MEKKQQQKNKLFILLFYKWNKKEWHGLFFHISMYVLLFNIATGNKTSYTLFMLPMASKLIFFEKNIEKIWQQNSIEKIMKIKCIANFSVRYWNMCFQTLL